MKVIQKKIIKALILVLVCISISYAVLSYYMMTLVTEPKTYSREIVQSTLKEKYAVDLSRLGLEQTMLKSSENTEIETLIYRNPRPSGNVIIFSHGVRQNAQMMLQFFHFYSDKGFDILTFSYRNHGESTKGVTTFGKYEVSDLKRVVEYGKQLFGEEKTYGIHGISMGSAIMLQYAGQMKEKTVDYLISDCSFSDLGKLLIQRLEIDYRPIAFLPLVQSASMISEVMGRGSFFEISPKKAIEKITVPILLIHGKRDAYIAFQHAEELYQSAPQGSRLVEMEKGGHAESYLENREKYEAELTVFLENNK